MTRKKATHSSHWGAFSAQQDGERLVITPFAADPDPSPLLGNFTDALRHPARVTQPLVRRGWLENGPGPDQRRGQDEYLVISWDQALDLAAKELQRIQHHYGPQAVFGGSYGWSSAGRFHHAQSQVHRFLNTTLGGYVRSVHSYSAAAAAAILPHIVGPMDEIARRGVSWREIEQHTEVIVAFGGLPLKNSQVASGGMSEHTERGHMQRAAQRGAQFISVSPLRSDLPEEAAGEWLPIRPGTDAALILAVLQVLIQRGWSDEAFLARYCVGWQHLKAYVQGRADGVLRNPAWAAGICGIAAAEIEQLAQRLVGRRVLVTVAHALQRAEHGEQPVWLGLVLAAALGQPGLPGGGYAYALGALGHYGKAFNQVPFPALPQGRNGVEAYIPVARIADMLLNPGETFAYNGQQLTYPTIKLAWWAGGNPFHHHQDLARLRQAFCRLDTLIVHENSMTATVWHADLVFPATMTLEREDIGSAPTDRHLFAMKPVAAPIGEARDDYAIFTALARRLGKETAFTAGRTSQQWLRYLYGQLQQQLTAQGLPTVDFDTFWQQGMLTLPQVDEGGRTMRQFREDPERHPLPTPSGKIEIFSSTIAGFAYADCPGHPVWLAPQQQPDSVHPLYLIANQPATRLHSQLDFACYSASQKIHQREVCTLHPQDAAARQITAGDTVRIFNQRGACLATACLNDGITPGVIQIPTGAWYDPQDALASAPLCRHGNPNVLTLDVGTSSLGQGCTGQISVVEVERHQGPFSKVQAFSRISIRNASN